jgi:HEAT repeat protein
VAALLEGLRDTSSLVRQTAVTQFAFTVPLTQPVITAVTPLLNDPNRSISALARSALDKARPDDAAQLESLGMMVQHSAARDYALHQLAQLGPPAGDALLPVLPLLQDDRPLVRYLAAEALDAMGPAAKPALQSLQQRREDSDPVVREAVADAIAGIEAAMAPAESSDKAARP